MRIGMVTGAAAAALMLLAVPFEATAQQKETIKLGFIGPVSGGASLQGQGARNGFRLAIKQANEAGYPYKVEGVDYDDESKPDVGVAAALKLVNDPQVVGAIGHWNSPVALATTPIFDSNNVPFIVWGAISPKITEANLPMVTRTTPTLAAENKPLAAWLVKDRNWRKFAIVSDTTDYGVSNTNGFTQYVKDNGGEIISTDAVPTGTTDFRPIITKIQAAKPDAVYFGGVITEAGLLRKQMAEMGLKLPMAGISGIYDAKYIEIAGANAAEGTIVDVPGVKESAKLQEFHKAYQAAGFKEEEGPYAKYAYDSTNILLEAIKAVGPKDKAKIAQHIRAIKYDGVLGTTSFDKNGQTMLDVNVDMSVVQDGKWVPWKDSDYASGKRKFGGS